MEILVIYLEDQPVWVARVSRKVSGIHADSAHNETDWKGVLMELAYIEARQ